MKCDECKTELIINAGFYVCPACGLQHEREIIKESSLYNEGCNKMHTCNKLDNRIQATTFNPFVDKNNEQLPNMIQQKFFQLLKKQKSYYNLPEATKSVRRYDLINIVNSQMNLSIQLLQDIFYTYAKIQKEFIIVNPTSALASCVYYVCMKHHVPISIYDICSIFNSCSHHVTPALILRDCATYNLKVVVVSVSDYIPKRISELKCGLFTEYYAKKKIPTNIEEFYREIEKIAYTLCKKLKHVNYSRVTLSCVVMYHAILIYCSKHHYKSCITLQLCSKMFKVPEFSIRSVHTNYFKKKEVLKS